MNLLYNRCGDDMAYYYLLIKGINKATSEDLSAIKHLFEDMMTNPQFNIIDNTLQIIDTNKQDISFFDVISNTNQEFFLNLSLYESNEFETIEAILKDIKDKSSQISFNVVYLNEKILLYQKITKLMSSEIKNNILKEFVSDDEFLNMIKVFLEKNQNSSEASKSLYLHRNTLNNRIDKFYKVTGYDLRKFEDAALIYLLVKDN